TPRGPRPSQAYDSYLNGFALHQNPQPEGNMNGWILEDDKEEEEEEEMEEENDDDDAEVINLYEEADPLNLPPPDSDTESEDMAVAPTPDDHEQEAEANTVGTIYNSPKLGRSGIRVRGVLLLRSTKQDNIRTTKKSF
ncbi:hypothetical protein Tco_0188340, partial [Tanacetum coccineum]